MSRPQPPQPGKLVIGAFMQDQTLFPKLAEDLIGVFGPFDIVSPWFDFDYTDYYAREMGKPLYRRMMAFRVLIEQDQLALIKLRTNELEQAYGAGARRRVNLDPGYLLYERFVLATGKNYSHRIYIGHGIYADLTLIYQNGGFQVLPWTYPDYAAEEMRVFLSQVRARYDQNIKELKCSRA